MLHRSAILPIFPAFTPPSPVTGCAGVSGVGTLSAWYSSGTAFSPPLKRGHGTIGTASVAIILLSLGFGPESLGSGERDLPELRGEAPGPGGMEAH